MAGHGHGNSFLSAPASLKPSNQNHATVLRVSDQILSLSEAALSEAALAAKQKEMFALKDSNTNRKLALQCIWQGVLPFRNRLLARPSFPYS